MEQKEAGWCGWWVVHCFALAAAVLTFCLSVYAAVLSYGALWAPSYVALVSMSIVIIDIVAFCALRARQRSTDFVYGVGAVLYVALAALLTLIGLAKTNVQTGQEFVEEHWYKIQTQVIPFTTEMDTKRTIASSCTMVLYMGILTLVLHAPVVLRIWKRLGGLRASDRVAMFAPVLFVQFVFAAVCLGVSWSSIFKTEYASDSGPARLIASSVAAALVLVLSVLIAALFIRQRRLPVSHYGAALDAALLSFAQLVIGIALLEQGAGVRKFVTDNYTMVQQMLPPSYQSLSKDKYITDSQLLFDSAGWLNVCLTINCFIFALLAVAVGRYCQGVLRKASIAKTSASYYTTPVAPAGGSKTATGNDVPASPARSDIGATPGTPAPPGADGVALRPATSTDGASTAAAAEAPKSADGAPATPEFANEGHKKSALGQGDSSPLATHQSNGNAAGATAPGAGAGAATATSSTPIVPSSNDTPATRLVQGDSSPNKTSGALPEGLCLQMAWLVRHERVLTLVSTIAFAATVVAIGIAMGVADKRAQCGAVVRGVDFTSTYNWTYFEEVDQLVSIEVHHSFPRGSVNVVFPDASDGLQVKVQLYGLNEQDVTLAHSNEEVMARIANYTLIDHRMVIRVNPALLGRTDVECLAATLTVILPSNAFDFDVAMHTTDGLNNLTSRAQGIFPHFNSITMTSLAGPIAIQDVTALGEVTAVSDTGRLRMDSVIGAPMTFSTHYANIIAINTTSYSLTEGFANLTMSSTGAGNIIITDIFAAWNASITTQQGDIIGVVCGAALEDALFMTTTTGNIFLNNFIMAAGARAHVSTVTGEVKMAAFTNNHLTIDTASGAVVLYEVFIGTPQGTSTVDYPPPALFVNSNEGAISALGVGATPTDSSFPNILTMDFRTTTADIKVEVNGGGFAGEFNVQTTGSIATSVNGENAGSQGTSGFGNGKCTVTSDSGDIELAMMPSPLGI